MRRVNLQLFLFLVAIAFMCLWLSTAGTAYANDSNTSVGDEVLWPGEGGGTSYYTIEGFVKDKDFNAISGAYVVLYGFSPVYTTTDDRGYFRFKDGIEAGWTYEIVVNGWKDSLGDYIFAPEYGQWYGRVKTDSNGHAFLYIMMERSAVVKVRRQPSSATQYMCGNSTM